MPDLLTAQMDSEEHLRKPRYGNIATTDVKVPSVESGRSCHVGISSRRQIAAREQPATTSAANTLCRTSHRIRSPGLLDVRRGKFRQLICHRADHERDCRSTSKRPGDLMRWLVRHRVLAALVVAGLLPLPQFGVETKCRRGSFGPGFNPRDFDVGGCDVAGNAVCEGALPNPFCAVSRSHGALRLLRCYLSGRASRSRQAAVLHPPVPGQGSRP